MIQSILISNQTTISDIKTTIKNIDRRPSSISLSQEVFQISMKDHQNALRYSWVKEKLMRTLQYINQL